MFSSSIVFRHTRETCPRQRSGKGIQEYILFKKFMDSCFPANRQAGAGITSNKFEKIKAVIPWRLLRLLFHFPLPFAGITQTGSEGLPVRYGETGTLSPMSSPSYALLPF